jgi:type VI secretion system protein ImpI
MDDKILESLEEEMGRNYLDQKENDLNQQHKYSFNEQASSMEKLDPDASHIAAGPMLRGLGVNLSDSKDMASMQALTEEIGASLQAAIRGLLSLHQQVSESRYGMMNKNLQPIEDNPLRLGLSYQKTMQTMFDDERSSVHLSSPSAIEESLANLRHHNEVVQSSASDALHQVVGAFSPDVLLRRFSAYRRPGDSTPESIDAWAWNMYQSYYCELTSDRQQGFEKLFWEIFDQSYDKALRDKQSEQRSG